MTTEEECLEREIYDSCIQLRRNIQWTSDLEYYEAIKVSFTAWAQESGIEPFFATCEFANSFLTALAYDHADCDWTHGPIWCHALTEHIIQSRHPQCVICQSHIPPDEDAFTNSCTHMFHQTCIEQWFLTAPNPTCPLCRNPLERQQEVRSDQQPIMGDNDIPDRWRDQYQYVLSCVNHIRNLDNRQGLPDGNPVANLHDYMRTKATDPEFFENFSNQDGFRDLALAVWDHPYNIYVIQAHIRTLFRIATRPTRVTFGAALLAGIGRHNKAQYNELKRGGVGARVPVRVYMGAEEGQQVLVFDGYEHWLDRYRPVIHATIQIGAAGAALGPLSRRAGDWHGHIVVSPADHAVAVGTCLARQKITKKTVVGIR